MKLFKLYHVQRPVYEYTVNLYILYNSQSSFEILNFCFNFRRSRLKYISARHELTSNYIGKRMMFHSEKYLP